MPVLTGHSVFESESKYAAALKQWKKSRDLEARALAINLSCEHRVTEEQEKEFSAYFKPPYDAEALKKALSDYQKTRVRPESPAFCNPARLVADCQNHDGLCSEGFDPNANLVHVLNLNKLTEVFKLVIGEDNPEWKALSDVNMYDINISGLVDEWLDRKLMGKKSDSPEIENFVKALFSVLNFSMGLKGPFNPKWVTTWDKFAPYAEARRANGEPDADRWCESVGVLTPGEHWQLVIKYPAKAAGRVYRPTQLDCGYYAYHFPSPFVAKMAVGGHPMDLAEDSATLPLIPEYIHEQIILDFDYWKDAGRLIGRTQHSSYHLSTLRKKHHAKLKSNYSGIDQWMPRAI
ncbi:MAG: hypothetical protein WCF57_07925 [Pyrinomonadaceae bacterium]